ncbi:MAG: hypothetical protein CMN30_16200 [Sandaracinus sp.]|nr:hypothetical protein [Sandaracinus sp.]
MANPDTANTGSGHGAPAPWVTAAIRAARPFAYKDKSPLRHNAINLAALAGLGVVWAGAAMASQWLPWWAYVPLAALAFGWVNFGLFVLVVHEASHNMFLVFRDRALQRRINRVAGWMVTPLFATHYGHHWEKGHIEHHVRPMEPDDPQRSVFVGPQLLRLVLGYLFVPGFMVYDRTVGRKKRRSGKSSSSKGVIVFFVIFWTAALTLATKLGGWPLAVALYLGIPVVAVFNLIKGSLEHGGAIAEEPNAFLRSRTSLFPLRHLLMPFNITLHFEHHLNFQVPWYDLGRYRRAMLVHVPPAIADQVQNRRLLAQLSGHLGGLGEARHEGEAPRGPLTLAESA